MMKRAAAVLYNVFVLLVMFVSLAVSIFCFKNYIEGNTTQLFISFAAFAVFFVSLFVYLGKLNFIYTAGFILMFAGAYVSYKDFNSVHAFIFYGLFGLTLGAGYIFDRFKDKAGAGGLVDYYQNNYMPSKTLFLFWLFVAAFFVLFAVFSWEFLFRFFNEKEIFRWYFAPRHYNTAVNEIAGSPFKQFSGLWVSLFYIAAVIAAAYPVFTGKIKNKLYIFCVLVAAAFIAKIVIITLSTYGMKMIETKAGSKNNGTYFYFAVNAADIFQFIKDYVSTHQVFHDNSHLKGHPVGAVLYHWLSSRIFTVNAAVNGLVYGLLTAFTTIALYIMTKVITKSEKAAFAAGLFYAVSPNSVIMSVSGIDGMTAAAVAWMFALYMLALDRKKLLFGFLSGVALGIGSNFTFGLWHLLLPLFLLYFTSAEHLQNLNIKRAVMEFAKLTGVFTAGLISVFLIMEMLTGGHLDYIASFNAAKGQMHMVADRPYAVWSWINFIHWSQYVSAALMALFAARYFLSLSGRIKMDPFSLSAIIAVAIQVLSCIGRAEVHRMWMFLIIFIIPVAALVLMKRENGRMEFCSVRAMIFTLLIFINSVAIEVFITDSH